MIYLGNYQDGYTGYGRHRYAELISCFEAEFKPMSNGLSFIAVAAAARIFLYRLMATGRTSNAIIYIAGSRPASSVNGIRAGALRFLHYRIPRRIMQTVVVADVDCLSLYQYRQIATRPSSYRKKYQSRLLEIIPVKRFTARGIVPRRVLNIHVFVYLSFRNSIERNGYTIFIPTPMVG